jgi:hypothetical protein
MQQVGIFVEEKHVLEYIRYLEELQFVSTIRENSGLYSFDSRFWRGGIENFKNLEGRHRKLTNILNRGPVKYELFSRHLHPPPPSA